MTSRSLDQQHLCLTPCKTIAVYFHNHYHHRNNKSPPDLSAEALAKAEGGPNYDRTPHKKPTPPAFSFPVSRLIARKEKNNSLPSSALSALRTFLFFFLLSVFCFPRSAPAPRARRCASKKNLSREARWGAHLLKRSCRSAILLAVLLATLFSPAASWAVCVSPAGNDGDLLYNHDYHVMQFCNGTNWQAMGPVPGKGAGNHSTVFVTSTTHNGNFGATEALAIAGANTICANDATAAGLPGTYKAWIAVTTGTDDPATTFTQSAVPYQDVLGNIIANNWAGLISGTLLAGISKDENGATVTGNFVWTNVATNGTASTNGSSTTGNCAAWTTNGALKNGTAGATGNTTAAWTVSVTPSCNAADRLYCFQQDTSTGCGGPVGNEGNMIYNSRNHVYQYCDGTVWHAMGPVPGTGLSTGSNTVFVTSATYTAPFGLTEAAAITNANTNCQNSATAAGLAGTYKAWIAVATGTDDPATTFTHSALPYQDVLGNTIANNWAGLISGTILHSINTTELGTTTASSFVPSNVATNGTAQTSGSNATWNCAGYTVGAGDSTDYGSPAVTSSFWTTTGATASVACNVAYPLYCFRQDGVAKFNRVFISSATYNGAIGSVAAANTDCQNLATAASLPGHYKAWLAVTTGTDDPVTTFTKSTVPYEDVLGNTIASNWAGLISGTLTNGIHFSETGVSLTGNFVWTNVATNGTPSLSGSNTTTNCAAWTSPINTSTGDDGVAGQVSSAWTASSSLTCAASSHLYCFQQDGQYDCTSPAGNEADMIYNGASHVYQYCDGTYWRQMQ